MITKRYITPEKYAELDNENQYFYDPQYKRYKTKKVRGYEECDYGFRHFTGWIEQKTPIGKPYQYKYVDRWLTYGMQKYYEKRFMEQAGLLDPVVRPEIEGDKVTINFQRFTPLPFKANGLD